MKRYNRLFFLLTLLFLPMLTPQEVYADIGPKPSVTVHFEGLEDESYSVTLLSESPSTGPWNHGGSYYDWAGTQEVWEAFTTYEDTDGFYFLELFDDCSDTDVFEWDYYPPYVFKVLLYFPEYDHFVVSADILERYAFDSYFAVSVTDLPQNITELDSRHLFIEKSYDFSWEMISLFLRVLATIAIELLLAFFLFGFRERPALRIITLTNIATQLILNIALNLFHFYQGPWAFVFHYVWMEALVFITEGCIYTRMLPRSQRLFTKKPRPWLYAFTANVVSFSVGLLMARWIPGIF